MLISSLEEFLSRKIQVLQNRFRLIRDSIGYSTNKFSYEDSRVSESNSFQESPQLIWNKSDTDLLELTTALFESKAIRSSSGKFNKKHLLQTFEKLFHHTVKGAGSKLTRARDRKTETAVFMEELKTAFSDYVSRKDNDLGSRRN